MSSPLLDQHRPLIHTYADSFNRGDLGAICRCFTPDAQIYGVLGWGGLEKARPIWEQLIRCFGMQLEIVGLIAEGDTAAVRYVERGRFVAPFRGLEPTGNSYEVTAMEWFVFRDGLIAQRWGARDSAAIFRQMGIPLE